LEIRSLRHLLTALEEFNHLGVRFISVQDQIDTDSPMGRAMFTIIGAMAELESSLISERVTAGMRAAETRGKHLGRPAIPKRVISEIQALATSTDLSIREIHAFCGTKGTKGEATRFGRRDFVFKGSMMRRKLVSARVSSRPQCENRFVRQRYSRTYCSKNCHQKRLERGVFGRNLLSLRKQATMHRCPAATQNALSRTLLSRHSIGASPTDSCSPTRFMVAAGFFPLARSSNRSSPSHVGEQIGE
jgi:hypothetical protein